MKIYKKGNYIYLVDAQGDVKQDHANEVKVTKTNIENDTYSIYSDDLGVNYVTFAELTQENGTAYASISAWELWYAENTGFNPASGGSGAGTVINTVSNFASLPDPTLASNDFYWVSNATGYRIIGTYKSNGLYYSNGTSWEYIDAPTTATQSEVNTGTLTDKYVTPSTFDNASKWTTKMDANVSINALNDVTITDVTNGQILRYNLTNSQWENVTVTIGNGDMQKATYDIDNDGIVDYAETIPVTVRNNSSSVILRRGTIVYLSGSTGYRPNAYKARANAESTSSGTFGVIISDIATNSDGLVACLGTLHNLDTRDTAPNPFTTDTLVDGDILWLDPNNAGYVTKTKPQAPNHIVFIGIVARTSPTLGRIVYRISNGFELDELHNVFINGSLANNDILYYESASLLWKTKQLTKSDVGLSNVSNTNTTTTDNITDSTDKRFITDAKLTVLNNTTNTNTGDETNATIKTKLGVSSSSNDGYFSSTDWTIFNNNNFIPKLSSLETYRGININNNSTTVVSEGGITMSSSASTTAQTVASTNFATKQIRLRYSGTVVSGGRYTGTRGSSLLWYIHGGFRYVCDFNISDTAYSAGCQQFYGLSGVITDLAYGGVGGTLVSTLTNIIGIGSEVGDTNLQVFHNDATGTATKIDLGVNFPANRTAGAEMTTVYSIELYNEIMSTNVKYKVTNNETGIIASGTISTNLPLSSQGLNFFASRCMSTTSVTSTGQFDLIKLGVYSQL
ncbi:hypothetical protein UFOVP200_20 [uncultured Caudovirales phage]|uniref:Uncharacterized protein n=1 Tax=uncultured Caudovirales phage TaxID=2100421 RepID=A0A6J7WN05_9CAUD|nr:hypothetical protein UFOVP200_20 [uncultured Caudovirales phage]